MVGLDGLEPSTSRLSGVRSNHLSYKPGTVKALNWYHQSLIMFKSAKLPIKSSLISHGKRNGDGDVPIFANLMAMFIRCF